VSCVASPWMLPWLPWCEGLRGFREENSCKRTWVRWAGMRDVSARCGAVRVRGAGCMGAREVDGHTQIILLLSMCASQAQRRRAEIGRCCRGNSVLYTQPCRLADAVHSLSLSVTHPLPSHGRGSLHAHPRGAGEGQGVGQGKDAVCAMVAKPSIPMIKPP
jgi:hypothetical protein